MWPGVFRIAARNKSISSLKTEHVKLGCSYSHQIGVISVGLGVFEEEKTGCSYPGRVLPKSRSPVSGVGWGGVVDVLGGLSIPLHRSNSCLNTTVECPGAAPEGALVGWVRDESPSRRVGGAWSEAQGS